MSSSEYVFIYKNSEFITKENSTFLQSFLGRKNYRVCSSGDPSSYVSFLNAGITKIANGSGLWFQTFFRQALFDTSLFTVEHAFKVA